MFGVEVEGTTFLILETLQVPSVSDTRRMKQIEKKINKEEGIEL